MSNHQQLLESLISETTGSLCAALVDSNSGMTLASAGSGLDLEIAAAGNTEVVRAKLKTMKLLGVKDQIDDILITLGKQYHILCPISRFEGVFVYFVLDRSQANLALARRMVHETGERLD